MINYNLNNFAFDTIESLKQFAEITGLSCKDFSSNELIEFIKNNNGKYLFLRGADLQGANLQEANLRWVSLRLVNLQGANLQGANLQEANLRWVNLQGADLQGANLQGADLRWANLQGANLQGANLLYTKYNSNTIFPTGFVVLDSMVLIK